MINNQSTPALLPHIWCGRRLMQSYNLQPLLHYLIQRQTLCRKVIALVRWRRKSLAPKTMGDGMGCNKKSAPVAHIFGPLSLTSLPLCGVSEPALPPPFSLVCPLFRSETRRRWLGSHPHLANLSSGCVNVTSSFG